MSEERKYKILVAEDNNINIQVARYILSPLASVLDFVMNGEDAVERFKTFNYDFIMMDIKMPLMDGYEATEKIRSIEKEHQDRKPILIIAMTANNSYEEEQACLTAGMDGFLSKPFNVADIHNLLKSLGHTSNDNNN
jgi:CheY-like chemotaxis protein